MPRKRKGPKREPSEGEPSAPHALDHNPARTASTTPAPTDTHRLPSIDPHAAEPHAPASKRAKLLTETEEDRLGKLVGLERWLQSVGHGRGAAVCVSGHVVNATPPSSSAGSDSIFLLELACASGQDAARRSNLLVHFHGALALKVSEPLLLLHRLGPPAAVFLSGFSAQLSSTPAGHTAVHLRNDHVVLKMSSQPPSDHPTAPTSAIWIEQLASPATPAPLPSSVPPVPASLSPPMAIAPNNPPEPSPSSQTSDWFSTPAPPAAPHHHLPQNAPALPPSAHRAPLTSLAPPPPQPRPPLQNASSATAALPNAIVKSEALQRSSSSPNPGRPSSSRQPTSASAAPRRNAPHVKPLRMGNCVYTPMSMARDGERASFIGVVVAAGDPRRSTSGSRDLSIKLTIADASCLSGTGYAKELARSMTVMLFSSQADRIPQSVVPGNIIAVRSVHIQMFSGKPQAVGKSPAPNWSWATYDPVSGDVRASNNFPLASHTPPECSPEEMDHFRDMANWFSELQGVDANIVTRSARPTLRLSEVGENIFFDTVVEVLKVYTHTLAPDLYVTDYTNHSLFFRGNDKYLRLESDMPYPDDSDGWGHVFQISLWDSHATIAEGLQTGDIIRIQNVRPKLNPRGLLTGGLGSSTDSGIKIRTLKPTDEARLALEHRRARFLETLFAAEEEAFADQVERSVGQTGPQPEQQQQQPAQTRHELQAAGDPETPEDALDRLREPYSSAAGAIPGACAVALEQSSEEGRGVTVASASEQAEPNVGLTPQAGRVDVSAAGAGESPSGATQPPFPTPAQRHTRALHETTPCKRDDRTAALATSSSNRVADELCGEEESDVKSNVVMGPPEMVGEERRALIRCHAPGSIPLTALATLATTSLCPGMYKVRARVVSTNPARVEQWARVECRACKRLLPLDERFCIQCGDEEGESLTYCLRFAVMLQESDPEFIARKRQQRANDGTDDEVRKVAVPLLFHGRSAEALLPSVDAKALFNNERACIKTLRRFHNRLLHPIQYGKEPEQILAVYSFPSKEADRTVRRFAALKQLNCLDSPLDLL